MGDAIRDAWAEVMAFLDGINLFESGAKLISTLLKKFKIMAYSAILGLVIGSVYAILPEGFGFDLTTGYGFVCLLFGVLVSILVEKLGKATEKDKA